MNKKIIYKITIAISIMISIVTTIIVVNKFINKNNVNTSAKLASNEVMKLNVKSVDSVNEELYINFVNASLASMTLEIFFDQNNLEYENNMENSNYSNGRILYTWVSETGKNKKIDNVGPFNFKSKNDNDSKIVVTGEFYNENGERIDIQSGSINITKNINENNEENVKNVENNTSVNTDKSNANLLVLRLNHEGISPEFSKEIKDYYIIIDETINKFDITTIAENTNSIISITGNNNFKTGLNIINISVKSEDKTNETNYKIYVTKTSNKEKANANLENLAVENGTLTPEFDANITNYKVEVSNSVEIANILAVPENINAKVKIDKSSKLEEGNNRAEIIVTAEDGITIKKYIVEIHRRNNEEEKNVEENIKIQAEKLSAILAENNNQEKEDEETNTQENNITDENKETDRKTQEDIYVYCSAGVAIAIIVICIFYNKFKRK